MILESTIARIINQQTDRINSLDPGLIRDLIPSTKSLASHALIISGVRRCGKSTLLMQMMRQMENHSLIYLNFESPQLYDFSLVDFLRLDNIASKKGAETLFFDEIQLVEGWELYIRQKLDQGFQVIVTGSNASLLSKELGTKLTGRHITQELFPFSYSEFLSYRAYQPSPDTLYQYLNHGGFPEYVKIGDIEQLSTLFNDILVRDIVIRYGIRDIKSLQRLAMFLVSNVGNRITATKLKQPLSLAATSTILSWFSYLELSYLFFFLPMHSNSTKAQLINPRKVYAIDPGMVNAISNSITDDLGRKLENLIFLHLRRNFKELYYFDNKGECDFVAMKNGKVQELVQVCYHLTPDNIDKELKGLRQAMDFFNILKASIVTFDTEDEITEEGYEIKVIPAHLYLTS